MVNYVIAADIGNTNTHIGIINCKSKSILSLDIFPTHDIATRFVNSLVSLAQSMKHVAPVPIVISSVVKTIEAQFGPLLGESIDSPVCWVHSTVHLPVSLNYDDPTKLGSDRLVNFLYGYSTFTGKSQIIISAGTTITIDYLKNGKEFCGGAILPGLSTQLKSLHDHTSALPEVEAGEINFEFPGQSTNSCINGGVRYGIAGALSLIIEKYRSHFNEKSIVLTTGGSWKYVQDLVGFEFEYIPELTLVGCALYYGLTNNDEPGVP